MLLCSFYSPLISFQWSPYECKVQPCVTCKFTADWWLAKWENAHLVSLVLIGFDLFCLAVESSLNVSSIGSNVIPSHNSQNKPLCLTDDVVRFGLFWCSWIWLGTIRRKGFPPICTLEFEVFVWCVFRQAEAIHVNPLYVLIPTTLCTSFSFLLPVSNPPNAVVFAYGHITIMDMVSSVIHTEAELLTKISVLDLQSTKAYPKISPCPWWTGVRTVQHSFKGLSPVRIPMLNHRIGGWTLTSSWPHAKASLDNTLTPES